MSSNHQHHPVQDISSKQQQQKNKNRNPIISRKDYHLTELCPLEEKQMNKTEQNEQTKQSKKNSAQILPYTKLIQTTGLILEGERPERRKNSTEKPEKKEISNKS